MRNAMALRALCGCLAVVCLVILGPSSVAAATALAAHPAPHWSISAFSAPTHFKPGDSGDFYTLVVRNDGAAQSDGSPVTITAALPAGVTPANIEGEAIETGNHPLGELKCEALTCKYELSREGGPPVVGPDETLWVRISVSVAPGTQPCASCEAMVSGGGAPAASVAVPTVISPEAAPFGFSNFSADIVNSDGEPDVQAGSHPFEMTTSFALNITALDTSENIFHDAPLLTAGAKDLNVALPPGLVGNPNAVPRCSQAVFQSHVVPCPADTQVGMITFVTAGHRVEGTSSEEAFTRPVYNVSPPMGQAAELGFEVQSVKVHTFFRVRSDGVGDYGLTAQTSEITQVESLLLAMLTIWGVPADPSHDAERAGALRPGGGEGECSIFVTHGCASDVPEKAFLRMPTSCQAGALGTGAQADSWAEPGPFVEPMSAAAIGPVGGCEGLSFEPSISVEPERREPSSPSGYTVRLRVPQNEEPNGLATPDLKNATVALPAGTVASPSVADGLQACSDQQFARLSTTPASCPGPSQIGTVNVKSGLLPSPGFIEGQLYLGQPECAPCTPADAEAGRMVRLFLQAQGFGVTIKLEGKTSLNQATGQLTTTFQNNPQLPFEELTLTLNGGPRAPLANPATCGVFTATSSLEPWSRQSAATPSSPFEIRGCGAPRFAPSFTAGTIDNQAGVFSPEVVTFSRTDQDQDLQGITVHTPPGLLGMVSKGALCPEAQAQAGTCAAQSQIGTTTVSAGPGSDPFYVSGNVYLTGPYRGAPFGLSIVVPAVAGPFNLGNVIVRAAIDIDRDTSALTITSDPLPQTVDGIPLQMRTVNVNVNREGFIFNPTNCQPLAIDGTLTSAQGVRVPVSSHYEAANCATLPFKPGFTVATRAKTSKANGASLVVKVTQKPGEANIHKVDLQLPKVLPSRLSTLQKACTETQFNTNPSGCPAGSVVGTATARTPVLQAPLTGPAYLVSHGGAAFPDLEYVLQADERGGDVEIILDGKTQIKKGITYSHFETVPDAPISSFETVLPEGPHSVLSTENPGVTNLCALNLVVPTTIVGQNGAQITQSTKIAVTGCSPITISRRKLTGRSVMLAFNLTTKGTVTVTGQGLKRYRKSLGAGSRQIKVALSNAGISMHGHHRTIEIKVALRSATKTSSATTTLKL